MNIKKSCVHGFSGVASVAILLLLSSCSAMDKAIDTKNGIKYGNNKSVKVLDAPDGITPPEYDTSFVLPEGKVTSSNKQEVIDLTPPDLTK